MEYYMDIVLHHTTRVNMTYKQLISCVQEKLIWTPAMFKELERLSQGWLNIHGTNTIHWMTHNEIAKNI